MAEYNMGPSIADIVAGKLFNPNPQTVAPSASSTFADSIPFLSQALMGFGGALDPNGVAGQINQNLTPLVQGSALAQLGAKQQNKASDDDLMKSILSALSAPTQTVAPISTGSVPDIKSSLEGDLFKMVTGG